MREGGGWREDKERHRGREGRMMETGEEGRGKDKER